MSKKGGSGEQTPTIVTEPAAPTIDYGAILMQQQKQQEEYMAEQQRIADEEAARDKRESAISDIDTLFGSKLDAANAATDQINKEIEEERANAATSGLDYEISDEERMNRINNQFAYLWSESDETNLANMIAKWGAKGYDWTSDVTRGDASMASGDKKDTAAINKKTGKRVRNTQSGTPTTDEDEESILGI